MVNTMVSPIVNVIWHSPIIYSLRWNNIYNLFVTMRNRDNWVILVQCDKKESSIDWDPDDIQNYTLHTVMKVSTYFTKYCKNTTGVFQLTLVWRPKCSTHNLRMAEEANILTMAYFDSMFLWKKMKLQWNLLVDIFNINMKIFQNISQNIEKYYSNWVSHKPSNYLSNL